VNTESVDSIFGIVPIRRKVEFQKTSDVFIDKAYPLFTSDQTRVFPTF